MADPTFETIPWGSDLAARAAQYGPRLAVHDGAAAMTYAALAARAGRLAHMLRERGAAHGEPVATALPNAIPAVWAAAAMRAAGVAEVALNAHQSEAERRHCLNLSGARLVVTEAAQAAAFRDLGCAVIAVEDVPADPAPRDAALGALPPVPAGAHGRISFTSGTTGQPKAIVTTHGARWIGNLLQRASFPVMPGPDSRVLLMTPFVHGAGILTMAFHDRGAAVTLLDGVHVPTVLRVLDEGGIDFVFAPPTVLAKLCAALEGRTLPGLKTIFTGTAPLLPSLYEKARAIFGPVIRVTYGKSEINNPIAALSPAETDAYYAEAGRGDGVCVGFPGTGVEIEIRDEDGAALAPGGVGEVHLRGRHMACGHIDAAGFHKLPPDGFHATGDFGRIDAQGRLHLVGRVADVIKSGGYKVHPDEIEHALAPTAPFVSVLSLPSEYWGEIIIAVAETADAGWPERARAALGDLARHKHPRAFLTMPELPRNAQGKVMRRLIREQVLAAHTLVDGPYPKLETR